MSNVVLRNCLDSERTLRGDASFVTQLPGGLNPNIGKIVEFEEYPCECWSITNEIEPGDSDVVTVVKFFDTCYECTNGPEYYQLVNCSTNEVYQQSGLPVRFLYTGTSVPENHPDLLLGKIISNVIDINTNSYAGCWRFEESQPFDEYTTITYENFFDNVVVECDCEDCTPEPEPTPYTFTPKTIYPEFTVPYCDPEKVEEIKCNFAEQVYKKMMSKRYAIKHCCDDTLDEFYIKHEILKLDMMEDPDLCKTSCCSCYTVTINQETLDLSVGNTNVAFNNEVLLFVRYCGTNETVTLRYNTVQEINLCLDCEPVMGYMANNEFVQIELYERNGVCSENEPCV